MPPPIKDKKKIDHLDTNQAVQKLKNNHKTLVKNESSKDFTSTFYKTKLPLPIQASRINSNNNVNDFKTLNKTKMRFHSKEPEESSNTASVFKDTFNISNSSSINFHNNKNKLSKILNQITQQNSNENKLNKENNLNNIKLMNKMEDFKEFFPDEETSKKPSKNSNIITRISNNKSFLIDKNIQNSYLMYNIDFLKKKKSNIKKSSKLLPIE